MESAFILVCGHSHSTANLMTIKIGRLLHFRRVLYHDARLCPVQHTHIMGRLIDAARSPIYSHAYYIYECQISPKVIIGLSSWINLCHLHTVLQHLNGLFQTFSLHFHLLRKHYVSISCHIGLDGQCVRQLPFKQHGRF